jgi:hypothetical protein
MAKSMRGKINSFVEGIPIVLEFIKKIRNPRVGIAEVSKYNDPIKSWTNVSFEELTSYCSKLDDSKNYVFVISETEYEKGTLHVVTGFEGRFYKPL